MVKGGCLESSESAWTCPWRKCVFRLTVAFSPNRGNAIWVDSNDAVNTSWTTPVETVSKVRFDSLNNLKRGPHCFACAGKECVIPRRKHEHSALTCGSGEVCWVSVSSDFGPLKFYIRKW